MSRYVLMLSLLTLLLSQSVMADIVFKEALIERAAPNIFHVLLTMGRGTAFIVNTGEKKVVLSAGHVCDAGPGQPNQLITLMDDYGAIVDVTLKYKVHPTTDICAIKVDPKAIADYPGMRLGERPLRRHEELLVLGYPGNSNLSPTFGFFTGMDGPDGTYNSTNAHAYPGNSGSPLINEVGEVVGLVDLSRDGIHDSICLTANTIKEFIRSL